MRTVTLTRDKIRALRLTTTYDVGDHYGGYNTVGLTLSQGIAGMGSSKENDPFTSRAGTKPDFSKMELSYTRQQGITDDVAMVLASTSQWSGGKLYSSEEFGYGGQTFGRAYDSSDILGDYGINGSVELDYNRWAGSAPINAQPYVFYDVGKVCSNEASVDCIDAQSAGLGVRGNAYFDTSYNFGLAYPLDHALVAPIYGQSVNGPRIILQISKSF